MGPLKWDATVGIGGCPLESMIFSDAWDLRSFGSFYLTCRPKLVSHASGLTKDPSLAEELVQEAFFYFLSALPELETNLDAYRFLKWKVRNLAIDHLRKNQRTLVIPIDAATEPIAPEPSLQVERADEAAVVSIALARLPERQREALVRTILMGQSSRAASAAIGTTESGLKQLVYRARKSLRFALTEEAERVGLSISDLLASAARFGKQKTKLVQTIGKTASIMLLIGGLALTGKLVDSGSNQLAGVLPSQADINVPLIRQSPSGSDLQIGQLDSGASSWTSATDPLNESDIRGSNLPAGELSYTAQGATSSSRQDQHGETRDSGMSEPGADVDDSSHEFSELMAERVRSELVLLEGATVLATTQYPSDDKLVLELSADSNLNVSLILSDPRDQEMSLLYMGIQVRTPGGYLVAVPKGTILVQEAISDSSRAIHIGATDLILGDFDGAYGFNASEGTSLFKVGLGVSIVIDSSGNVSTAHAQVLRDAS